MRLFSLQFENKELETKYQQQQEKFIFKCSNYYIIVLMLGKCMSIIDNILYSQFVMLTLTLSSVTLEIIIIYLINFKKLNVNLILSYTNCLCFSAIGLQFTTFYFTEYLHFTQPQYLVMLDTIHQYMILFNYGQSHIFSSIIYVLFLISRVFLQAQLGFTSLSLTFTVFGILYIIDQYQKAKQRRKQFLKSQRNKLLEQLIREFIDDKVCIIEKDEDNVKFIPIIINNKLQELQQDINSIIKQIKIIQSKESLQCYLYKSIKNYEILIGQYQSQMFEITYQRFIIKKCQIFVKIKQIYNNQSNFLRYKDLYTKQQNILQSISKSSQEAMIITKQLKNRMFVYWFQQYYCIYKKKIQLMKINKFISFLVSQRFDIVSNSLNIEGINSDLLLIKLLIKFIQKIVLGGQMQLKKTQSGMQLDVQGLVNKPIKKQHIYFINKLLFHIGIGMCEIYKKKGQYVQIIVNLFDLSEFNKYE